VAEKVRAELVRVLKTLIEEHEVELPLTIHGPTVIDGGRKPVVMVAVTGWARGRSGANVG